MTYTTFDGDSFEPTMNLTGVQSEELIEPQDIVTPDEGEGNPIDPEVIQGAQTTEGEETGPWWNPKNQQFDPNAPGSGAGFIYGSGDPNASLNDELAQNPLHQFSVGRYTGMYDFAQDFMEWAAPELGKHMYTFPEYQQQGAQVWRNLWSFLGPTGFTASLLRQLGVRGQALTGAVAGSSLRGVTPKVADLLNKLGKDKLFALVANAGVPIGSGVFVDSINDLNAEGENLASLARNQLPENWKWLISENLAVVPTDGPDEIRKKQILEGVYLSLLSEALPLVNAYFKAKGSLNDTLEVIAKDARAIDYQAKIDEEANKELIGNEAWEDLAKSMEGDELLEAVDEAAEKYTRSMIRRVDQMDEVSRLGNDMNPKMDEPMMFRDADQFDSAEEGIITAGPDAVRGAMRDNAEILNNSNSSYGRVRNMVSEAGRMFGLKAEELTRRTLVNMIKDEIIDAGKFDVKRDVNGVKSTMTYKQMDEAGTDLMEYLIDPVADKGFMTGLLSEFTEIKNGLINLNDVGLNAVSKAIDYWKDEYFNLDAMKASALLQTSFAGQIADIAEGARRFPEEAVIQHAKDEILERLEFLTVEQAIGKHLRGQALNFLNRWKRRWNKIKKSPEGYREYLKKEAEELGYEAAINAKNSVAETKRFFAELRHLADRHPQFVKTFLQVNELTDGNVHTLMGLVDYWKNNYGIFSKMFYDRNPNTPSVIANGMMGNYFNSMLSAPKTANKAGLSNAVMLIHKPLATFSGAVARQDWEGVKRGWYAFNAFGETMRLAAGHAAMVFRKLWDDPTQVPYAMRENIALKNQMNVEAAHSFAEAAETLKQDGARYFANMQDALEGLVLHPIARGAVNAMGAFDGFTRAFNANGLARYRAYDESVQMGDFRPEVMEKARLKHLDAMKKEGYFVDPEVDFNTREMAMNLDHPVVSDVDMLIKKVPALRLFMPFARIYTNVLGTMWNNSFLSAFAGDYREIVGMPGKVHTQDEIEAIFKKRGKTIPTEPGEMTRQFEDMKNEIAGRVGFSSLVMGSMFSYIWSGNCRGDGHRDPAVQRARGKDWTPRTCRNPVDGKWYSYDALGPQYSEWIALVANTADNFDELGTAKAEELFNKAFFVLAASLTKNNFAVGLEPLLRFFSGNPQDMARFSAGVINSQVPLASLRSEFGKLLSDGTREVNNTFEESMLNRNRWTEIFGESLPVQRNHITGDIIGAHQGMFARLFNFFSPVKITDDVSPEQQFLIDIEYDSTASLLYATNGVEFTTDERSELGTRMGEQQHWRKAIQRAMKMAEKSGYLEKLNRARQPFAPDYRGGVQPLGYFSEDLDRREFQNLYNYLDGELEVAKKKAEEAMTDASRFLVEANLQEQNVDRTRYGGMPILRNK